MVKSKSPKKGEKNKKGEAATPRAPRLKTKSVRIWVNVYPSGTWCVHPSLKDAKRSLAGGGKTYTGLVREVKGK